VSRIRGSGSLQNVTDPEYLLVIWIIILINWRWKLSCLSHSSAGTFEKRIFTSSYCSYTVYLSNLTVLRNHPLLFTGTISVFLWLYAYIWAYSLESLMDGHNWFLNQFVEIPRRSIMVCFLSLSAKAGLNFPTFDNSCSWPPSRYIYFWCVSYGMKQNMFFSTLSLCSVQGSFPQDTKEKGLFFQCCGSG